MNENLLQEARQMFVCIDAIEFDKDNGSYDDCFIIELSKNPIKHKQTFLIQR